MIILKMEIEHSKKHAYLDEYKILKTLGAGYHATYLWFYSESSLVRMNREGLWLSKSIRRRLLPLTLSNMNLTS